MRGARPARRRPRGGLRPHVLFPLIEAALPEHELVELASAVERSHSAPA